MKNSEIKALSVAELKEKIGSEKRSTSQDAVCASGYSHRKSDETQREPQAGCKTCILN